MTNNEMQQLLTLVQKLEKDNPDLTVLVTNANADRIDKLVHHNPVDFFCPLEVQLDICIFEEENNNIK